MRMCFDEVRRKVVKTKDGGILVVEDHSVNARAAIELNLPEPPHTRQQQVLYQLTANALSYLEFMRKWRMGAVQARGIDLTVPLEDVRKKQREQDILHHKREHPTGISRDEIDRNIIDSAILLSEKNKREEH